jgi:hypothetical protein
MITRKSLGALAVVTLLLFASAAALGNHHHGVRQAAADVAWNGFLLGLLLLVIGSVLVLVRTRGRLRRS